jgi:preprotein translocase subunit YajC
LQKKNILSLGIILVLLLLVVSLGGCVAPATTTGASGTTSTTSSSSSIWFMLGFIVILFGLMYFFTIRPQRKKQQEAQKMLQALQRGDRVITNAGIYGQIESVYEDSFLIKTDSGSTMRVAKWAVVGKQPDETPRAN